VHLADTIVYLVHWCSLVKGMRPGAHAKLIYIRLGQPIGSLP